MTDTNCTTQGNEISCPTTSAALADPESEVAIGGRIYTVRELAAMYATLENYLNSLLAAPKPEPTDVPAIHRSGLSYADCAALLLTICEPDYTCADKRRVLLTSEDGVRHCILFPKEQQ